ncbi:ATP-binding protein [Actinomycetospora sp. CA-101289]|uniref:ATP-binding protein n=1 Tax=Actinomycetospora sp. CA-101289 TaxID=3239893 RepID=UPI003D969DB6
MVGGGSLVGREREAERLRQHVDESGAGRGRFVLITGEPGVGKSSLARVAVEHARCSGSVAAWGRCAETEGAPPFWPWIRLLRSLSKRTEGDWAPALQALTGASPDSDRFRLFDSVTEALTDAASTRPAVLVFDDLHRADEASLALLRFVLGAAVDHPLLCLGTYRDGEVSGDHPLFALAGEASADLVRLTGLTRDQTATFVRASTDAGVDVDLLHDRTGGNPFFLGEVLRLDGGLDAVPTTVDAAIRIRVGRLPEVTQEALAQAAVLGREVVPSLLAGMRGTTVDDVAATLAPAVGSGLISGPGTGTAFYRFDHVLVQQALYQHIDPAARVVLHRAALAALARFDDEPAYAVAIAHHAVQAADSPEARVRARTLAERAADHAAATAADGIAADWCRRALALVDAGEPARTDLLVKLGRSAGRAGHLQEARRSFEEAWAVAARRGSAPAMAAAALGLGEMVVSAGTVDVGLVQLIERTLARLPDDPAGALDVALRARLATELYWGPGLERARTLARQAAQDARALDDPRCLAGALAAQQFVMRGPDGFEERLAVGREVLDLARHLEDEALELGARRVLVPDCLQLDIVRAEAEIDGLAALADRSGRPLVRWYLQVFRGVRTTMQGRVDEALAEIDRAETEGRRLGIQPTVVYATGQRFTLLRQAGRTAEAEDAVREQAARWPVLVTFRCQLALLLADTGRRSEALAALDSLLEGRCGAIPRDSLWLASIAILAETAACLEHPEHCSTLYDLLVPYRGRIAFLGVVGWWGAVDHYLGLTAAATGRHADASGHFAAALRVHQHWQAPLFIDASLRGLRRAEQRAGADAVPTPAPEVAPDDGLTRREAEVLDLLAGGASNKEIARALALSVHTVERHVANLYGKIGARNRADATSYALTRRRT